MIFYLNSNGFCLVAAGAVDGVGDDDKIDDDEGDGDDPRLRLLS